MNKDQAAALRAPFAPNQIGHLPKGNTNLDFVGHAVTTARLLDVDPDWTWAPVAYDERGLPRLDEHGGLWMTITIAGVTRLGYGDSGGKKGPNGIKEAIGDGIRNGSMRFGVALDLWAKEDLQAEEPAPKKSPPSAPPPATPSGDSTLEAPTGEIITAAQVKRLWTIARKELELSDATIKNVIVAVTGQDSSKAIPDHLYDRVIQELRVIGAESRL